MQQFTPDPALDVSFAELKDRLGGTFDAITRKTLLDFTEPLAELAIREAYEKTRKEFSGPTIHPLEMIKIQRNLSLSYGDAGLGDRHECDVMAGRDMTAISQFVGQELKLPQQPLTGLGA